MSDNHFVDWTTADARKWLEKCCVKDVEVYAVGAIKDPHGVTDYFSSEVFGVTPRLDRHEFESDRIHAQDAVVIASHLEALPQLLGYIEELEEIVECMDDNGLSALLVIANKSNQDTISQQAAEIERLKNEQ